MQYKLLVLYRPTTTGTLDCIDLSSLLTPEPIIVILSHLPGSWHTLHRPKEGDRVWSGSSPIDSGQHGESIHMDHQRISMHPVCHTQSAVRSREPQGTLSLRYLAYMDVPS